MTAIVVPSRRHVKNNICKWKLCVVNTDRQLLILNVFGVKIYNHDYTLVPALIIQLLFIPQMS